MLQLFKQVYLTCGHSSSYSAFNMSDIEEHNSEQSKRRSEIEETDSAISIEEAFACKSICCKIQIQT